MTISVIICTRNREESLKECIDSILCQTRVPDEIVVIDDGALNIQIIERECSQKNVSLIYYPKKQKPGLTVSRNIGITLVQGEIIIFLDDDVILESDYILNICRVFQNDASQEIGGVGGLITNSTQLKSIFRNPSKIFYRGIKPNGKSVQLTPMGAYLLHPIIDRSDVECLSGCNMAYRKKVFNEFQFDEGLSDYALGEDFDFSYRVGRKYRLIIEPNAKLIHKESPISRTVGYQLGKMQTANRRYQYYKNLHKGLFPWLRLQWALLGVLLVNVSRFYLYPFKNFVAQLIGNIVGLFTLPTQNIENNNIERKS